MLSPLNCGNYNLSALAAVLNITFVLSAKREEQCGIFARPGGWKGKAWRSRSM